VNGTAGALAAWWPDLAVVMEALRAAGRDGVADELMDAMRGGATSTEILGRIGLVLDRHGGRFSGLDGPARAAAKRVEATVEGAFPGSGLRRRLRRLLRFGRTA
jgi:hypothetical protein